MNTAGNLWQIKAFASAVSALQFSELRLQLSENGQPPAPQVSEARP
jgi:hypothetical protein